MEDFITGRHETTIDAKGRVILPALFRRNIVSEDDSEVKYMVYFDEERTCLELYTPEEYKKQFVQTARKLDRLDSDYRAFVSKLGENSLDTKMDSQGRVKLPKMLLEKAKITKNVVLIGALFKIEIWDPKIREDYSKSILTIGEMERKIKEEIKKSEKNE